MKYVVSHLDEQMGPFDEAELKAKWIKGELLPIDYVYDEAKSDWILLSERFAWASAKAETDTPPPLNSATQRRAAPPSLDITKTDLKTGAILDITRPDITRTDIKIDQA